MAKNITHIIQPREKDLGGFSVRRILPYTKQRMVGPFIFFDHLGPATFMAGEGIDVRPHPHINLATITYLFEGELLHHDSLGIKKVIKPGAISLMTAGKGIAHSERTPPELRNEEKTLHALQLWIALPEDKEECAPSFEHTPVENIPELDVNGVSVCVMMGAAYGAVSPVTCHSKSLYLEASLEKGQTLELPAEQERALYVISGEIRIGDEAVNAYEMAVLGDSDVTIEATAESKIAVIGGDSLGERHIWWNFVSSRKERIEQAKEGWNEGRFDPVEGENEVIPLPEGWRSI